MTLIHYTQIHDCFVFDDNWADANFRLFFGIPHPSQEIDFYLQRSWEEQFAKLFSKNAPSATRSSFKFMQDLHASSSQVAVMLCGFKRPCADLSLRNVFETYNISTRERATVCAILLWKQICNFSFSCNRFKKAS